jgi:hypothetical protein
MLPLYQATKIHVSSEKNYQSVLKTAYIVLTETNGYFGKPDASLLPKVIPFF